MKRMFRLTVLVALAAAPAVMLLPFPFESLLAQAQRPGVVAIRGGTVLTVTRGTITNGVVVLSDGKIAAVGGANTAIPNGADIVDASGRFVSPGIIDAHSHIGADSINEGGTTVSSMTGIEDVLNPTDINIQRDLAGGLTVANVLHGSANPIGGKNSVIKLRWGKTRTSELLFEGAMPGIKFALGENPKDMRFGGGGGQQQPPRRYPATRMGVEFVIRDAFTRAKAYQKDWQDYNRRKAAGEDVLAPRRDLQLEPLVEILEGKRLVHAHCYRADEILMLLRLADDFGFKIATLQHVLEGYKVADEIAAHGAGASTFSDWWGYKVEAEDAIPYNAALMVKRGVLVSINSDSAEHARRLNTEAAKSIHWGGLGEDEALALVTINPAKQLRVDNRVGSLDVGKDADVVVWNKHPLSSYAIADRVYIDGTMYYDRFEEDRRLTDARQEKSKLAASEGQRSPTAEPQTPRPQEQGSAVPGFQGSRVPGFQGSTVPGFQGSQGLGGVVEQQLTPVATGTVVITNARIHPITRPVIERGSLTIRDGRIASVDTSVMQQPPAGALVIDAKGADVYPGFIDARTVIGINEPGPRGFEDVGEMLDINAALKAHIAYQWDSDAIAIARANGVTSVAVVPTGGLLGGQIAVMNLDGWSWEQAAVKTGVGVSFQFPAIGGGGRGGRGGENPERKYDDLKRERDARVKRVEDLLAQARAYGKVPAAERRTDWNLEALVPIAEGRAPLFVQANNEREIRDAVAFADRTGVKIVITGGLEAPVVAPLLKEKNIPVLLGSILTTPTRADFHHAATYRAAGELAQAGVRFAFGTGDYTDVRAIPYEAAISVAWGLDRDRAIRALTVDAAEILGVADRIGSLEPGKIGNVAIWNGDPLEIRTPLPRVLIAGREVGPDNKHLLLYQKFSSRPTPNRSGGASAPPKGGAR
jgi:imidazolonepropionase-like amidohydrolase